VASFFLTFVLIVTVVTITGAAYFSYPWVEEFTKTKIESYMQDCELLLHRMFQEMPRKKMLLIVIGSTVSMALLGFIVTYGYGIITAIFTLVLATIGYHSFRMWLKFFWERRVNVFNEQLVDALNLLANSLKSGLNLSQALQVLIQESKNPTSQEFGMVLSQEKLGLTVDEALEKMLDRIPSDDLAIAIHSVLILRETGGDLSETFETIASTIRERRKVSGKIKSMTQQGKLQGLILLLLPFGLGIMLYIVNPPYIHPLYSTQLGWMMLIVMFFFQFVGWLWIRKIVNIDV
jgi:tight adherence protein B